MSSADANWYNRQIKRVPMLTAAEEITLGSVVQEWLNFEGGPEQAPTSLQRRGRRAKDRMVEANLRLVVTVAHKWSHQVAASEYMDLIQAGNEGLIRAVEKFDPTRGYKFSTYGYWWIRQGVTRHIETRSRIIRLPSSIIQKLHRISAVTRQLIGELRRTPSKSELAGAMGISTESLQQLVAHRDYCLSLDARANGNDGLSTIGELIADPNFMAHEEHLDQLADVDLIKQLLSMLDRLDAPQRYLLEGTLGFDGPPQTITELARELNIKATQASKLLREAKSKLRWLMQDKQINSPALPIESVSRVNQLELTAWDGLLAESIAPQTQSRTRQNHEPTMVDQPSFW